jgi:hypothetical protein
MNILRENRDSVMAMLEAFVYDPLISWRLVASSGAGGTLPEGRLPKSNPTSGGMNNLGSKEAADNVSAMVTQLAQSVKDLPGGEDGLGDKAWSGIEETDGLKTVTETIGDVGDSQKEHKQAVKFLKLKQSRDKDEPANIEQLNSRYFLFCRFTHYVLYFHAFSGRWKSY